MRTQLEKGDYLPYFVWGNPKNSIQNSAGRPLLFVTVPECTQQSYNSLIRDDITTYIVTQRADITKRNLIVDKDIYDLFPSNKHILVTPNLKIEQITSGINLKKIPEYRPPILIVPDVITETLRLEIIDFFQKSSKKNLELKGTKNRTHVFMDADLTTKLDLKLAKSLFPELKKVYNIDVTYRENYKICGYDSATQGKFHAHRDSVHPYNHRRYAMSLILNDDYRGSGIVFPEYNQKPYRPPACSALIFPTPLYHEVLEVTGGTRYVIISFLFGDQEGVTKNNPAYKIQTKPDWSRLTLDHVYPH